MQFFSGLRMVSVWCQTDEHMHREKGGKRGVAVSTYVAIALPPRGRRGQKHHRHDRGGRPHQLRHRPGFKTVRSQRRQTPECGVQREDNVRRLQRIFSSTG